MKYFVVEERDKEWGSNTYNSNNITLVQDWLNVHLYVCTTWSAWINIFDKWGIWN